MAFFFSFGFARDEGVPQAKDQTHATGVAQATVVTTPYSYPAVPQKVFYGFLKYSFIHEFLLWLRRLKTRCSLCEDTGLIPGLAQWLGIWHCHEV